MKSSSQSSEHFVRPMSYSYHKTLRLPLTPCRACLKEASAKTACHSEKRHLRCRKQLKHKDAVCSVSVPKILWGDTVKPAGLQKVKAHLRPAALQFRANNPHPPDHTHTH